MMAVKPPKELGNPELRQAAQPVPDPTDPSVQELVVDLSDTLRDWRARNGWGRAISGPQIGDPRRVVLIEMADARYVLINPRFEQWSTTLADSWESCITFPTLWGCVSRPASVVVLAQDEHGNSFRLEAEGDLARIVQHEMDHLDGLIWLDRDPDLETICTTAEYRRRFKELR